MLSQHPAAVSRQSLRRESVTSKTNVKRLRPVTMRHLPGTVLRARVTVVAKAHCLRVSKRFRLPSSITTLFDQYHPLGLPHDIVFEAPAAGSRRRTLPRAMGLPLLITAGYRRVHLFLMECLKTSYQPLLPTGWLYLKQGHDVNINVP